VIDQSILELFPVPSMTENSGVVIWEFRANSTPSLHHSLYTYNDQTNEVGVDY